MIKLVTPCTWTLPYFIISHFSAYLFCSFPYPSPLFILLPFCFPYFDKEEGRER